MGKETKETGSAARSHASTLEATLEAILYLKGEPVPLGELADGAGCTRDVAKRALKRLMAAYGDRDGALEVVKTPQGYCLQLRAAFGPLVEQLVPADLGVGALRTLAVVALKGPVALAELVEIRGSGAYQQVQDLVDRGFVSKRPQPQGRSSWVQVTDRFHRYFQLAPTDEGDGQQLRLLLQRYRTELAPEEGDLEKNLETNLGIDPEADPEPWEPVADLAP
jgi:segregation and condensation protein B